LLLHLLFKELRLLLRVVEALLAAEAGLVDLLKLQYPWCLEQFIPPPLGLAELDHLIQHLDLLAQMESTLRYPQTQRSEVVAAANGGPRRLTQILVKMADLAEAQALIQRQDSLLQVVLEQLDKETMEAQLQVLVEVQVEEAEERVRLAQRELQHPAEMVALAFSLALLDQRHFMLAAAAGRLEVQLRELEDLEEEELLHKPQEVQEQQIQAAAEAGLGDLLQLVETVALEL
jgi:hypothetical protein